MSNNTQRKNWVVNKKCDIFSKVVILSLVIVSCLSQNASDGNELFRQYTDVEASHNISEPKTASLKMNTEISDSVIRSVNIQKVNNNSDNSNSSGKGYVKSPIEESDASIENVLGSVEKDPILSQLASIRGNESLNKDVWTKFSWLSDLYDHHKWSMRHYANVTKDCAHKMKIYLDALKKGEAWAAKMSDASGRYNGQFFFGNDFWLGSSGLCAELRLEYLSDAGNTSRNDAENRQTKMKHPPFLAAFSVARLQMLVGDFTPQTRVLLMGVCMPASCTPGDVEAILKRSAMEAEGSARHNIATAQSQDGSSPHETVELKVVFVRPVPGNYNMWEDVKFFIVGGAGAVIVVIIVIASVYEAYVNSRNSDGGSDVTSVKNNAEKNGEKAGKEDAEIECQNNNVTTTHVRSASNDDNGSPDGENGNVKQRSRSKFGTDLFSEVLLSFSALSNTEKIMKTEDSTEDAINCIHGLRFMSLAWVIMVHTYLQLFAVADNKTLRLVTERNFFYQTVGNASYSVDTFFFISGLLVTFLYHKSQETKKAALAKKQAKLRAQNIIHPNGSHFPPGGANDRDKNHMHQYAYVNTAMAQQSLPSVDRLAAGQTMAGPEQFQINNPVFTRQTCTKEVKDNLSEFITLLFYRIVRLTPAYLFVIGINELGLRYSHNNSVFEPMILDHINCDRYWWRNILYINNLYPQTEMCMVWSWYMANDTQFYVIGITLLLLSKRHFKLSSIILVILMISSWLTSGYISVANNYHAKIQEPFEMFDQLYDKPWSRLGPYLIGMITGWYLWRTRGSPPSAKWVQALGWPCSLGIMASLIYGMKDGHLDLWPTAFYVSIGHTAWGASLAWLVISCTRNRDGLLSRALSYRGALPLSRLAYCAYLVHPTIMMISTFQMDGPVHLHNGIILIIYAGNTVMSYLMSFAISLAFEAPVVRLLKINFSHRNKKNN